jgi:hypothetical protein
MRFEVKQGTDGLWYWHLKAANNEIVAQGEGYSRKADAYRAVGRLKTEVWRARIVFEVET